MIIRLPTGALLLAAALLSSAVHAADETDSCKYVQIGELPLHYTGPLLQVTAAATINGLAGPVLVDTGAEFSSLSRAGFQRRKLSLRRSGLSAVGIGGKSSTYATRLDEFSIGPVEAGSTTMLVTNESGLVPRMDGIVGSPHLLRTDMEFSLAEKKMRFFSGEGCGDKAFLAYWGGEIFEIPFKRQVGDSPNPHFTVEVNGVPMEAIIDTGAQVSVIMGHAAKRVGIKLGAANTGQLGDALGSDGSTVRRWGTLADLKIGAETVKNAEISVLETENFPEIDIVFGDDFLRAHRVLFAMSQRKLYISYVGGQPFKQQIALAPWIVQEAEAGNADAQMELSTIYRNGRGVAKDARMADTWLMKAVDRGLWRANVALGLSRVAEGRYDEGITYLRAGLDKQPAELITALWLHVTLDDALKAVSESHGLSHLGSSTILDRIDLDRLFKAASEDKPLARQRGCAASAFIIALKLLASDTAQAESLRTTWLPLCTPRPAENKLAAVPELLNSK